MVVNQKQLAKTLGITDRRVRQLKEDGFFNYPENERGYVLEKCVQEYIDYKIKAEMNTGAKADKEAEQAEHEMIKKNISILKLRRLKRELHEAADVEYFLEGMLVSFKNKLLSIPSKIAIKLIGIEDINKIIEILSKELIEVLETLSKYEPDEIDHDDNGYYLDNEDEQLEVGERGVK